MINTPVYFDVMTLIQSGGLGIIGLDVFGGEWGFSDSNKEIDEQVLCLNGVGAPSELKDSYENPAVQILVRGGRRGVGSYRDFDVYCRAKGISDFLLSQSDRVCVNGITYAGFEEASNIAPLGRDKNERCVYSMNFSTFRNR